MHIVMLLQILAIKANEAIGGPGHPQEGSRSTCCLGRARGRRRWVQAGAALDEAVPFTYVHLEPAAH